MNRPGLDLDQQDQKGFSPLLWACANGQTPTVELLLYKGASLNLTADNGESGLLLAACYGHADIVEHLLRAGADVNQSDELYNTALMYSAYNNHSDCVAKLLRWGADLYAENADRLNAYALCTRKGARQAQLAIEEHLLRLLTTQV
ncbi:hypothetical protein BOX15_Mlig017032g3 [Macrostomum lignano]|uniref:Uncharacterized protein n=1 Tax=Macrostomum lignano TaxID=282301 RepID=A0A267GMQ4_9PLAT|nr:hypothetical protein BOX15_Mlig017032g3 [Macrostomum lignano]